MLKLRLLGATDVSAAGQTLTLPPKRLALTSYLALAARPVPRTTLAGLFWNEGDDEATRRNLRQELHRMRGGPLESHLTLTPDSVCLTGYTCDALNFVQAQDAEALPLYGGPLLPELYIPNADGFMEWLTGQREALHTRWLELKRQEAALLEAREDWREALHAISPLLEHPDGAAAAQAMRLHARLGQHRAVDEVYRHYQEQLTQLGDSPPAEVAALHARLRGETAPSLPPSLGSSLAHPPLIGREALLEQIMPLLHAGGRLLLLEGEPGTGKTTLAGAAVQHWGSALRLQGREESQHLPFYPLLAAFRANLPPLRELPDAWQQEISRLLPALRPETPPPADAHGEGRTRFLSALGEGIRVLARANLLFLDDLHWFDAATLEVISLLRPQTRQWRAIATLRPLEAGQNAALSRTLSLYGARGEVTRLSVPPLSETETLRLIRAVAPPGTQGTRFARRLYASTQGNPLFLLETIRALLASGDLREEAGAWHTNFDAETADYHELPLPASVASAIQARLTRLSEAGANGGALLHLLGAAALLGGDFSAEELGKSTPLDEWTLLDTLEQAVTAGLLTRQGGERYRFSHALVQRSILESLTPERRRFLHRRLAATLEQLTAAPARLAPHLEGSGQTGAAAQAWLAAADQAERVYAHQETLSYLQRALKLDLPAHEARIVHLRRADTCRLLDDRPAWKAALQDAAELSASDDLALQLRFIELAFYSGQYPQVIQAVQGLQAAPLSAEQRGWALLWLGNAHNRQTHMQEAMRVYAQALEAAPDSAHELRGRVLNAWAYAATETKDLHVAQEKVRAALNAFKAGGFLRGQCMALNTAGTVEYLLANYSVSARHYQESFRRAQEIGDKTSQRLALTSLSGTYIHTGQLDEALETVNAALELLEETPDAYTEGFLLNRLVDLHLQRQQPERALRTAERWQRHADTHGFALWSADSRLTRAELLLHQPDQHLQPLLDDIPRFLDELDAALRDERQQRLAALLAAVSDTKLK